MLQETSSKKGRVEASTAPSHDHVTTLQPPEKLDEQILLLISSLSLKVFALPSLWEETYAYYNPSIGF